VYQRRAPPLFVCRRIARRGKIIMFDRRRKENLDGRDDVLEGPGFLYRPRQILLEIERSWSFDVVQALRREDARPDEELSAAFAEAGLPIAAFLVPAGVHIPELVLRLRRHEDGDPVPNVGPNHVLSGEPDYHGGPHGAPRNADPFGEEGYPDPEPGPAGIAVLDTGYDPSIQSLHPRLADRVDYATADIENALTSQGYLALEGGHGTFIDDIVMRVAPLLRIRQVRVLDPAGVGDDATVTLGMARADAPVINLSLGGYTQQDLPPTALSAAIGQLDDTVAVVAAAGNNGSPEPFYPAALKTVVAVGGLDTSGEQPRMASFSNYGNWVDVYAPAVDILSGYLRAEWKLPTDPSARFIDGYAYWDGTSFAAPIASAMIADQVRQGLTARQARYMVVGQAPWLDGVGPVLIPDSQVIHPLSAIPEAYQRCRGQPGGRAVLGGLGRDRRQRGGRPAPLADQAMPAAGESWRRLVGQRQQRGDDRAGADREKRGREPGHLVAWPGGRQRGIAGRQHDGPRCAVQPLQVADGERSVGEQQRGEQRVVSAEAAMRGHVSDVRSVEREQGPAHGGVGPGQQLRARVKG
jgi:hypothetical protein